MKRGSNAQKKVIAQKPLVREAWAHFFPGENPIGEKATADFLFYCSSSAEAVYEFLEDNKGRKGKTSTAGMLLGQLKNEYEAALKRSKPVMLPIQTAGGVVVVEEQEEEGLRELTPEEAAAKHAFSERVRAERAKEGFDWMERLERIRNAKSAS